MAMIPALTFDLIFILDLLFWMLMVKVERRRRALGFEAGDHRLSHLQAGTSGEIAQETGHFLFGRWRRVGEKRLRPRGQPAPHSRLQLRSPILV